MPNLPYEKPLLRTLLALLIRIGPKISPDALDRAQLAEDEQSLLVALLALAMPSLPFDVIEEMPNLAPTKERLFTALQALCRERMQKVPAELLQEHAHDRLASELAMVVASNLASGRARKVMVKSGRYRTLSLPALVAYVDRVIPNYIKESPRVTALAARDEKAWHSLGQWLLMRSKSYLRKVAPSDFSAPSSEEFSQQVCLVLLEKLSQYHYDAPFNAWLSIILRNAILQRYTRSQDLIDRNPNLASLDRSVQEGAPVSLGESLPDPSQAVAFERIELLFDIATLSEREREVLIYFYVYRLLDKETAPRLGISKNYVAVVRRRALKKLRDILGPNGRF